MKKAAKRTKSKSSSKRAKFKSRAKSKSPSKRAGVKSKRHKTTKAKRPAKSSKTLVPKVGAKVKRVAKKAAVAASLAAIGTALSELQPEQKRSEGAGVNEAERKGGNTSTR
jgi:hypothetical protein